MRLTELALAAFTIVLAGALEARPYLEIPVSGPTNRAYLTSMSTRPWWDKAWTRRAPLLVSSTSVTADRRAFIDMTVDPGEKVVPREVRLVTPWETEIPVVCEAGEGTEISLQFETPLRIRENRPFLLYWGNPAAKAARVRSCLSLDAGEEEVRLSNGILEVVFDNRHRTRGLLKVFRLCASQAPNQLLERATGYAWSGFNLRLGPYSGWSKAEVIADNALKKTVRFRSSRGEADFTLRAGSPRLDYTYRVYGEGGECNIHVSWACGGSVAYDEIVYPAANGTVKAVKAAHDTVTDCVPEPKYDLTKWLSEGWCAVRDKKCGDTVGVIFDRASLRRFFEWGHGQAAGVPFNMDFRHLPPRGVKNAAVGSGALVATQLGPRAVRDEWRKLSSPPVVALGAAQGYRAYPVKIARLDRDYCADYNIGRGAGAGWASGEPLEGDEWARNLALHLRAYGATVVRFGGWNWETLPFGERLYGRFVKLVRDADGNRRMPAWSAERFSGAKFREMCAAAHACGLAVNIWAQFCAASGYGIDGTKDESYDVDREIQLLYPSVGVDAVHNAAVYGESPYIPRGVAAKNGRNYWQWKNPREFFDIQDKRTELVRKFYRRSKERYPDLPVVFWNSENAELSREMMMSEQAGYFDTCMVEIIPRGDMPHVKHVAKRMRALFDNRPAHTVHHHFFYFNVDHDHRIREVEMPFICGVNGFSQENLTYENYDRELSEITADFHRFAGYTGLGEKVAKMAPVKNLALLRDSKAFRADILARRTGRPVPYNARHDGRIKMFGHVRNYNFDIVVDRYFTRDSLARYNAVFVPEDEVFSDALARELLAFVKSGGGAVVEGRTIENGALAALGLKDGEVRPLGEGRIVWLEKPLSDTVGHERIAREMKKTIAAVGGENPYEVSGDRTLDSVLQGSDEGFYLGVYNKDAHKADTGVVKLSVPLPAKAYVLDVKRGVRQPLVDGTFTIAAGPRDTAHYLIGGDAFTAVPAAKEGEWTGARARASFPTCVPVAVADDASFVPVRAFEFAEVKGGKPVSIRRSRNAAFDITCVSRATGDSYDPERCRKELARSTYVHIMAQAKDSDALFADCAEELKALLRRGGAILFDKVVTGPAARRFLKEAGVFDPTATAEPCPVARWAYWGDGVPTDHALFTASGKPWHGRSQSRLVYRDWDRKNQFSPVRIRLDRNLSVLVLQENVYGKGRVVFSENFLAFTDWYEQVEYGDSLLSWIIGMPVTKHAEKVERLRGGPGVEVVR